MEKNKFWRSYGILYGSAFLLALVLNILVGYAALVARVAIIIVLLVIIKKFDKSKEEPRSANFTLVLCLLPVFYATYCFYGPLNRMVPFTSAALVLATVITTVYCEELLYRKVGVMLIRGEGEFVPSVAEVVALVGAETVASIFGGHVTDVVWAFGISVLSLSLFLLTKSIDLSITIHLLLATTQQLYITFSTLPHLFTGEYFQVFYASAGIVLALTGYAIIKDNCLMQMPSEEN